MGKDWERLPGTMCGTWTGVLCFYLHQCLRLCGMEEPRVCGMSGILACHLTGLYLVLIVTLLVSMGIFRAPQAGQGVWKGHRHCQVSGSACAPGPPGRLSLALGHTLIQGNSCEIRTRGCMCALSYGVYFSQSHYKAD